MPEAKKRLPVAFFRTNAGVEPVRAWLSGLGHQDRRTIGFDIARVEFGWPIGMPVCRAMGGGMYEVRSSLASGRIVLKEKKT